MTDDDGDLRARLAHRDPARRPEAAFVDAVTAEEIRERTMQTIDTAPSSEVTGGRRGRRTAVVLGAAAAVLAVAVAAAVLAGRDGGTPGSSPAAITMTLKAPDSTVMSSCVAFDVAILRDMPVAFAGTVVETGSGTVTLDVDRWYKGGSAERVTIRTLDQVTVSVEGVEFTAGNRYLVTATDGTVNGCGFSGPATSELERAFAEAFPG